MSDMGFTKYAERFEAVCKEYAENTAITFMRDDGQKDHFTFNEVFKNTNTTKEKLKNAGLYPGDRVAIISPTSPNAFYMVLALAYSNITYFIVLRSSINHSFVYVFFDVCIYC